MPAEILALRHQILVLQRSRVVAGGCLFLAGAVHRHLTSLSYYDDVQYARIQSDGHLSHWTTSPGHLRIPRSNHSLVSVTTDKGIFLNAVAGVTQIGEDTVHLDTVEVAKVGAECTVSEWTIANYHLKGGRSTPQALVVRNNVVVTGEWGDLDLLDILSALKQHNYEEFKISYVAAYPLGRELSARYTVPSPSPNRSEILRQERPSSRSLSTFEEFDFLPWAADSLAFGLGVAKTCSHSFLNKRPLKFGHCANNLKHQPARRRAQI